MNIIRAYLVDIKYKIERNIVITMVCRDENGKLLDIQDYYRPSFLIYPRKGSEMLQLRTKLSKIKFDEKNFVTATEVITKKINNVADTFIQVFTSRPETIKHIKETILEWEDVINIFEDDLSLTRKYMIYNKLIPFSLFEAEVFEQKDTQVLKVVKFIHKDISFMEPQSVSVHAIVDEDDDNTILALACNSNNENVIFTSRPISSEIDYIIKVDSEQELLTKFRGFIIKEKPDVLIFDNQNFGLKQIMSKAIKYKIDMNINLDGTRPSVNSITKRYRTLGINEIFLDRVLATFFKTIKSKNLSDSDDVNNQNSDIVIGNVIKEKDINDNLINQTFKKAQLNLMLFNSIYNNLTEIMKFSCLRFGDMFNLTLDSLIEWILVKKSVDKKCVILNKDKKFEFVTPNKESINLIDSVPGIYNNIAVLDLTPIYPEIIIKNNISAETINLSHKERVEQEEAVLPAVLNEIGDRIERLKTAIENMPNENLQRRHDILEKIFYGFYGYLGNKAMRWSSEDLISLINMNIKNSITNIINEVNKKNSVIFSDLDEMFIELKQDSNEMLKDLRTSVVEARNVEIKQISKRGFFLPKLESFDLSKRLAILNDTNTFTARNLLRQSYPIFIQEAIKTIIKLVLIQASKDKILNTLKDILLKLENGEVNKKDIATNIVINRNIELYNKNTMQGNVIQQLLAKGETIKKGDKISFLIAKGEGSITRRAKLLSDVKDGEYDHNYYKNKLLFPALEDILILRGITVENVVTEGKQSQLDNF